MKKGILILCAAGGVLIAALVLVEDSESPKIAVAGDNNSPATVVVTDVKKTIVESEIRSEASATGSSQSPLDNPYFQLKPEEMVAMYEWGDARGYDVDGRFTPNYESMDDETLLALANQNDPKAHLVLANRILALAKEERSLSQDVDPVEKFDTAEKHFYAASVLGYSSTLNELSELMYLRSIRDFKGRHEWRLAAYKFAYISERRGDPNAGTQLDMLRQTEPLSEADNQFILMQADNTYNEMSLHRSNLGLPEFDNTASPEAQAALQRMREYAKEIAKKMAESLTNKQN